MNRKITFSILGVIMLGMLIVMGTEYLRPTPLPLPSETASPQIQGKLWSARPPENAQAAQQTASSPPATPTLPSAPVQKATLPPGAEKEKTPAAHEKSAQPASPKQTPETLPSTPQAVSPEVPVTVPDPGVLATEQSAPVPTTSDTSQVGARISSIVVYATKEGATVRINGTDLPPCKVMRLKNPERLVLDMYASCSATVPGIPANRLVNQIRIGKQGKDTARIVIDLKKENATSKLISKNAHTLDIRLY